MIDRVSFHKDAELELNDSTEYYVSRVKGLGVSFIVVAECADKQIRENPEFNQRIFKSIRRKVLWRFLFSIMYSITDNSIRILAIANQKRRPFYWRSRK